jgi:hypothetical protein
MKAGKMITGGFFIFLFSACNPTSKNITGKSMSGQPSLELSKDSFFLNLFNKYPGYFDKAILDKNELGIQIIYSRIDRNRKGKPSFTDFHYNTDPARYFYPASTVKLPVAILALQKLNELNIPGLDRNSTMITGSGFTGQTEVYSDATAADGRPTIAHYIRKILLVSDNDAFNRLYEFLGQEYINEQLHAKGFGSAQIIHRLQISLPEEQNRNTNPVTFYDTSGKMLYEKPNVQSVMVYATRDIKMGKGFYRNGELVDGPFDFSRKNRLSLEDLHGILRSVIFPEAVSPEQRFNLTAGDYRFLRTYMSMWPRESSSPRYEPVDYKDTYVKFIFYGAAKENVEPDIRIFNKPGDAYGFMIDAAYVVDFANQAEFMVSAVIHCNSDGIFNDDKYDYDSIGYPFMKNLGRALYDYERTRDKKFLPDLSSFRFRYNE